MSNRDIIRSQDTLGQALGGFRVTHISVRVTKHDSVRYSGKREVEIRVSSKERKKSARQGKWVKVWS